MSPSRVTQDRSIPAEVIQEIINTFSDGVVVYSAEGEIISCNDSYRRCYPEFSDKIVPGARLQDILRAAIDTGDIPDAAINPEAWIEEHLRERLNPISRFEEHYIGGRWWRIFEHRANDGTVINQRHDITEEKAAEMRLAKGLAEPKDEMEEAFVVYDAEGRLVSLSEGYASLYPSVGDLVMPGGNLRDVLTAAAERGEIPEAKGRIDEWVDEKLKERLNPSGRRVEKFIDGRWWRIAEHKTAEGGVVSIRTDVTRLRDSQLKMTETQALLVEILDGFRDGFAIFDLDDRLTLCNPKFQELMAVPAESLVPESTFKTVIVEASEFVDAIKSKKDRSQWVDTLEAHYSNPDGPIEVAAGKSKRIHVYQKKTDDGNTICLLRDVTDQRVREHAQRENEARATATQNQMKAAIESISDGFLLYDFEDRFVLCNQKYREMMPEIAEYLVPGQTYERLIRAAASHNLADRTKKERDAWIKERLKEHTDPSDGHDYKFSDGRWFRFNDFRTPNGDYVGLVSDLTNLKQTEAALKISESKYRDLIDLAPDLICVLENGVITLINPAGARNLGARDADILIGQPFKSFVHPDFQDSITDDFANMVGKKSWIPLRLVRIGGTVIDAELAASNLDQAGSHAVMVVVRDTTERNRAAETLLHREERLRGIMDTVIDGIISIDDHGIVDSFNAAAERIFGYSAKEVTGRNIKMLMPDPYHAEHDGYLTRYLRTGEARIIGMGREVLGKRKDGSLFPLDLSVNELRRDGRSQFIGVVRDITDRKESEAELRESEERYALAIDGTNEIIWDWDIEKDRFYVAPRIQEVFGIDTATWTDPKSWQAFLHPDEFEAYRGAMVAHLKGETEIFEVECRLAGDDDHPIWFRQRGVALRDTSGWAYRMAGSIANITERKRNEAALQEAKELADVGSRAKTEFLANMSHELRTPLNAIIGFSDIMRDQMFGPLGNSQYEEYALNISESGKHLLDIINDILDVARIEAGTLDLHSEWVDIASVVELSISLMTERAAQSGVTLRRRIQGNLPKLKSEPRRIKQIMLNLLSNAVKFTPKGGQITTQAKLLKSGDLVISVIDNGIGMSPDEIETALIPFGQVDSKLARKYEGTGLGLPLTKAFVELHGGELSVRSEPKKGTTITVRFPSDRLKP